MIKDLSLGWSDLFISLGSITRCGSNWKRGETCSSPVQHCTTTDYVWVRWVWQTLQRACDSPGETKHISGRVQTCVSPSFCPRQTAARQTAIFHLQPLLRGSFSCAAALSHRSRPPGCTPGPNSTSRNLENILNSNVTGLARTGVKTAKLWHLKLA